MEAFLALITQLLSNEAILVALVGLALHFYRQFRGDKAGKEIQAFDLAVKLAYDGVRNYAALFPHPGLDKAGKGIELFSRALKTELGRDPNAAELESARLHFEAIHAQEAEAKAWRAAEAKRIALVAEPATGFQTPPVSP